MSPKISLVGISVCDNHLFQLRIQEELQFFFAFGFQEEELKLTEELDIMHSVLDTYIEVPTGHSKWRYSSTWTNEGETEYCQVGENDCEPLIPER